MPTLSRRSSTQATGGVLRLAERIVPVRSWAVVLAILVAGCGGDGLQRAAVEGTVTVGDRPLESGSIVFVPGAQTKGPEAAGRVVGGRFRLERAEGPVVGRHKVRIFGDENDYALDDPLEYAKQRPPDGPKNPIAEQYNQKTVLEASVAADGPNRFEFEVERRQSR